MRRLSSHYRNECGTVQLIHDLPEGHLFIRRYETDAITVIDRRLAASFLLSPDQVFEPWLVKTIKDINNHRLDEILALDPELVLLGTGIRQIFPKADIFATFLSRKIGIEVMDNAAACRTFNLLVAEGRRVVAGFMLDT